MRHKIRAGVFKRRNFMGEEATCIAVAPPLNPTQVDTVYDTVLMSHGNAHIGEATDDKPVTEIHLYTPEGEDYVTLTLDVVRQVASVIQGDTESIDDNPRVLPYITEAGAELFPGDGAPVQTLN